MVEENNSYERVIDRSCPLCTLPVDGDTDSLCTQCRSRVLLPIESVENSQQSTQPIVQTKKSEESQRVSSAPTDFISSNIETQVVKETIDPVAGFDSSLSNRVKDC